MNANFFTDYKEVFCEEVNLAELEGRYSVLDGLYAMFNRGNRPHAKTMRSMSVSDLVWTKESGLVFVDSVGFTPIRLTNKGLIKRGK